MFPILIRRHVAAASLATKAGNVSQVLGKDSKFATSKKVPKAVQKMAGNITSRAVSSPVTTFSNGSCGVGCVPSYKVGQGEARILA